MTEEEIEKYLRPIMVKHGCNSAVGMFSSRAEALAFNAGMSRFDENTISKNMLVEVQVNTKPIFAIIYNDEYSNIEEGELEIIIGSHDSIRRPIDALQVIPFERPFEEDPDFGERRRFLVSYATLMVRTCEAWARSARHAIELVSHDDENGEGRRVSWERIDTSCPDPEDDSWRAEEIHPYVHGE